MSNKLPDSRKRLRRPSKARIEPIHLEELLAGAGMSGFLGVLDAEPSLPNRIEALLGRLGLQAENLPARDLSSRVSALAARVDALTTRK